MLRAGHVTDRNMATGLGRSCRANCRGCATSGVAAARRADERLVEPAPVPAYLLRPMNHPRLATGQALTGITAPHRLEHARLELAPRLDVDVNVGDAGQCLAGCQPGVIDGAQKVPWDRSGFNYALVRTPSGRHTRCCAHATRPECRSPSEHNPEPNRSEMGLPAHVAWTQHWVRNLR